VGATAKPGTWLVLLGLVLGTVLALGAYAAEGRARAQSTPVALEPLPAPAPVTLQAGPGDAGRGRVPYERSCGSCHGNNGRGEAPLHGPLLNAYYRDDRLLAGLIRNGLGTMPGTAAEQLDDQRTADVVAFIRSLP